MPLSKQTCEHQCVSSHCIPCQEGSYQSQNSYGPKDSVIICVNIPESPSCNLTLVNHSRGDHSFMFSFCFSTGTESRCELQHYALFINRNTKRTTSFQLLLVMRGQVGHTNLLLSKTPKPVQNMNHRNLAKQQESQVYFFPCSCQVICIKIHWRSLKVGTDFEDLGTCCYSLCSPLAHMASVPLPIHFGIFSTLPLPLFTHIFCWLISLAYSPLWT